MSEIKKVTIKTTSSFWMSLRAFSNRLTITPHSVRCSFKPENRNSLDAPKTWSYKTDNSQLSIVFKAICMEVQKIIKGEYIDSTDTGEVVFELLYDDGTKVKESYWADIKDFSELYSLLNRLVPDIERPIYGNDE